MQLEIGKIYDGKVTGITKFGAFIELDKDTTGMVHISEVAQGFVTEIKDHLTDGQEVKVKVMSVGEDGKISLSIKKAMKPSYPPKNNNFKRDDKGGNRYNNDRNSSQRSGGNFQNNRPPRQNVEKKPAPPVNAFEDMLSKFKQNSEEKMGDLKRNIDSKRKNGSRRSSGKF